MALTITTTPQDIHPVYSVNGIPVKAQSSISGDYNLKLIFDLSVSTDGSGLVFNLANRNRISCLPGSLTGRFNPAESLKNYLTYDFYPYTLTPTACTNSFAYYKINIGEEFSTFQEFYQTQNTLGFVQFDFSGTLTGVSVGDEITVKMDVAAFNPQYQNVWTATSVGSNYVVTNCPYFATPIFPETGYITRIMHLSQVISGKSVYNGTKQYYDNDEDWELRFNLTGSTSKFLTNYNVASKKFKIREEEAATLSCLIKSSLAFPGYKIKYKTYDESDSQIGEYDLSFSATVAKLRFDIPTGTFNLKRITETNTLNSNVEPIFSSSVKRYTVQVYYGSSAISQLAQYQVVCSDNRYIPYRFAFLNLHGGIDYMTFDKKSYFTSKIKKENIDLYLDFDYNLGDRGETTTNVDVEEYTEIYTGFISDEENVLIREMEKSKEVYYLSNGQNSLYPITVEVSDFTEKTTKNTNGLKQYKIKFKYAYPNII